MDKDKRSLMNVLLMAALLGGWLLLQLVILPKLGVST